MSAPDLVIVIGAMKAGTTTLFQRLGSHPEIVRSNPKEPVFFGRDDLWKRGYDWYQDRWPSDLDGRVRLEASTGYSMQPRHPHTFRRMRDYLDDEGLEARFVYSLRDPLERIRSQLTHWRAAGMEDKLFDHDRSSLSGHALTVSMYAMQLDAFLEHFDRDALEIVRFEDLTRDPDVVVADLAERLGLESDRLEPGRRVHNPSVGKYEKSWAWEASEAIGLDRLTHLLPEAWLDEVRSVLGRRIEAKVRLSTSQREAYLAALDADLRRLRDHHGIDVDAWTLPTRLEDETGQN